MFLAIVSFILAVILIQLLTSLFMKILGVDMIFMGIKGRILAIVLTTGIILEILTSLFN